MTTYRMGEETRPIGWFRSARKAVERFPETVKDRLGTALTIAAEGGKADIAKPLKGLGPGVTQIAVRLPDRRLPSRLRHGGIRDVVGDSRVSEEIQDAHQYAQTRD